MATPDDSLGTDQDELQFEQAEYIALVAALSLLTFAPALRFR